MFMTEKDFEKVKDIRGVSPAKNYLPAKSQWFSRHEDKKLDDVFLGIEQKESFGYADGGEMESTDITADLEKFNIDNLDYYEYEQYNHFLPRLGKAQSLQLLINTVDGDTSQLSPELAELAEKQGSSYADGGFMNNVYANGGGFANDPHYKSFMEKRDKLIAQLKSRVVRAVGIDEAMEFFDYEHSSIAPYRFLERAVQSNLIALDEINKELVESALEETKDLDSDEDLEEIGSSDFTYYLKNVLDEAGFNVGFVNSRLRRLNEDGSVKEIENNYANGGDLSDVDLNFDFETEGDAEFEYPQEVEKIKLLRGLINFDEVRGAVDYGKTKDNTDLQFYKKGKLVMTVKGDYDVDAEILDTEIDILGIKHRINYHPYDSMGGLDYSALKRELEKTNFADGGFMNNVYKFGGNIKDLPKNWQYKVEQSGNKPNDNYFSEVLYNGETLFLELGEMGNTREDAEKEVKDFFATVKPLSIEEMEHSWGRNYNVNFKSKRGLGKKLVYSKAEAKDLFDALKDLSGQKNLIGLAKFNIRKYDYTDSGRFYVVDENENTINKKTGKIYSGKQTLEYVFQNKNDAQYFADKLNEESKKEDFDYYSFFYDRNSKQVKIEQGFVKDAILNGSKRECEIAKKSYPKLKYKIGDTLETKNNGKAKVVNLKMEIWANKEGYVSEYFVVYENYFRTNGGEKYKVTGVERIGTDDVYESSENNQFAKGGELKGSFSAVIQVPYNYEKVVLDDFEFTEFLSKALTKKWFGNGIWNVTIEKQLFEIDYAQKIVVKIDIPVGVTQGGGLDKFEVGEFISKTLTKKWFGNGIWGVYIVSGYADGGSLMGVHDGTAFMQNPVYAEKGSYLQDNEGFMRADNEFNYRYPEKEVYIETLDEPIDLTSTVTIKSNEVVISPIDENIDLNDDNRIRARMTQSNRGSAENFGKINPRAFEFIDLPMPTSNTHKND